MPYISDAEWTEVKKKVEILEREMDKLKYIKGQPIVQAYAGKRLDLNENINAVALLKRIADAEARITALETP